MVSVHSNETLTKSPKTHMVAEKISNSQDSHKLKKSAESIIMHVLRMQYCSNHKKHLSATKWKQRPIEYQRDPEINPHSYYKLSLDKVAESRHKLEK